MAFVSQPPQPQTLQMKILGLYTNNNQLSSAPDGALSIADNIWISKDSIAESRRGFGFLPFSLPHANDRADKSGQFQNKLLIHYNDSNSGSNNDKLAYYDNSSGLNIYSGSYKHPDPMLAKMKFAESNQNIYFTTSAGIFKNDLVTNTPVPAGMYQALDCTATASPSGSGFMANNAEVAYRVVWGTTDANNNLVLGAPSSRAVISNTSGSVQNVSLAITIPTGINVNNFFQVYRSDQSLGITANATLSLQDITYTAAVPSTPGNSVTIAYTTSNPTSSGTLTKTGGTGDSTIAFSAVTDFNGAYVFTVTSANATLGATYTNNSNTYTVTSTIASGTTLCVTGVLAGSETVSAVSSAITVTIAGSLATDKATAVIQGSLVYTSVVTTNLGNSIAIVYSGGGTAGSEVVTVSGTVINVKLQSGTSTATQVAAAINGSTAAISLVTVSVLVGATAQVSMNPVYLSGGSTAAQVAAAINGSAPALALVTPAITGNATNFQVTASAANLSGGSVVLSDPDDSMQLVYEANPTSAEITAKSITVIDETPDSLRGAALYTNATQQGILQANNVPPYALDLCLFQTCMFYGNVQTAQQMFLTVLAVGGSQGIQVGDTVTIAGTTYTGGSSENVSTLTFQVVTTGSAAQNINDTTLSLIRVINQNSTNAAVYAYYLSSTNSLPGQMLLQARTVGTSIFNVTASAHGSAYSPALPTSGTTVASTNTASLNGLMYSKASQPEAVPSLNILYVGSASKPIRRIIPVRNSLFIFKDDGVFRCTGVAGNFAIDTIDTTIILLAPESAVALSNQVFCYTTQGVVSVSDNGGPVISRPIEDQLLKLEGAGLTALQAYSFAVAYESERQYCFWTISSSTDTYGTQCFIYNTFTKTWTRSTRQQTHGLVLTADNKMYLLNGNGNSISQERKSYTYQDYSDEAFSNNIVGINGQKLSMTEVNNISVGDRIYQSDSINSLVTAVDYTNSIVTVFDNLSGWTVASCTVLRSIACLMEWLPNAAGNPGYLRHWHETACFFRQNLFNSASLNFYSEISDNIESVPITANSSVGWGQFPWDSQAWGGVVNSKPFRTYVPREKQRCDLLSIQFQCQNAWGQFQIEGLSCILDTVSERMTL